VADLLEPLRAALEGRYAVERLLGQGGMATVYLARDSRHDRPVAIKVLRPELAASIGADRFLREIKLAAHLQHPNILALYDSGEAGGFLYYVMPFVAGESLRARLEREKQLSLPDAIQLTCEVAEALHCAHGRGIIHRDIKPENILIQEGHALVADFGIARAVSEAGGDKLTETGMAVGTPHYMSPEQALGGDNVDGRSDEYSLGCVTYEMLVGQPPFHGPNPMAILARHSMEAVPSLQVVRHSIPDEVEDAVMRSLEKTPADRFPTVREFSDALLQVGLGPTARRTSSRALQAVRRTAPRGVPSPAGSAKRRLRVWAAVASALVILAGAGWATWRFFHRSTETASGAGGLDPHRIAVLYFQNESDRDSSRYVADGLTEGLIQQLDQVQSLDVISKGGVGPFRGDSIPRDSIARALRAGTLVTGTLEPEKGRLRVTTRLVDGASGAEFARASFEQPAGNLLGMQDTLVQKVASLIRERLGEEIRLREQRNRTRSVQAWALVQRAEQARKQAEALAATNDTTGGAERAFRLADSMYSQAQSADSSWSEPLIGRAGIAYRRSRLAAKDPVQAKTWADKGEKFADAALALSSQNPDALEVRGTLRYWSWILGIEADPTAARKLLADAQNDLETAVKVRPSQAGAWAMLSHLYNNRTGGETDAKLAARRAYEEDAYLSNADQILWRLFLASYDLSQFVDAAHWCEEGQRRFAEDFKFVKCQLWMLTTRAKEPDVSSAWRLADSLAKVAPADRNEFERLEGRMIAGIVLARAGMRDSARRVAQRSRGGPEVDPFRELMLDDSYIHLLAGDREAAFKSLKVFLAANPERRVSMADDPGWWFRSLQDDPKFQALVGGK
jgi:TolB-like protein/tRNA A-37 threonylcarbamoyl transferase component Bud32